MTPELDRAFTVVSAMIREEIDWRRRHGTSQFDVDRIADLNAVLALLTPEAEAKRRLGAAVREAIACFGDLAADWADGQADTAYDDDPESITGGMFRAIAAALREESGQ